MNKKGVAAVLIVILFVCLVSGCQKARKAADNTYTAWKALERADRRFQDRYW